MDGRLTWIDGAPPSGEWSRGGSVARTTVPGRADRAERWRRRLADTPASLEEDIRTGLRLDEFSLVYQPRHELHGGRVAAVEALLRWRREGRAGMSPEVFLGAVADTAVRDQLIRWVLHHAVLQAARWEAHRPADASPVGVSINVGPEDVLREDFIGLVALAAESVRTTSGLVQIEVGGRATLPADPALAARLQALARLDVSVVLDGVDPWYGSDGFFLPCRGVNIARRWVRSVGTDSGVTDAVGRLVERAHASGIRACAIGVESRAQARALDALGCDLAQGFLFSEPVPPSELGWHVEDAPRRRPPASSGREGAGRRHGDAVGAATDRAAAGLPRRGSSPTRRISADPA